MSPHKIEWGGYCYDFHSTDEETKSHNDLSDTVGKRRSHDWKPAV